MSSNLTTILSDSGTVDGTYVNTGLSYGTQYYFQLHATSATGTTYYYGVYAYHGTALSSVLQGSQATTGVTTNSSVVNCTTTAAQSVTFDPTSISTIDVVEDSYNWSSVINGEINGGYHGASGDFTTVAIANTGGGGITWTLNASEEYDTSDPGIVGSGASSVSLTGVDDNVYFRVRAREIGGSVGSTATANVTVTHGASGQSNIVSTWAVDAEVISGGGGNGRGS
jgi:hypothetical protein